MSSDVELLISIGIVYGVVLLVLVLALIHLRRVETKKLNKLRENQADWIVRKIDTKIFIGREGLTYLSVENGNYTRTANPLKAQRYKSEDELRQAIYIYLELLK